MEDVTRSCFKPLTSSSLPAELPDTRYRILVINLICQAIISLLLSPRFSHLYMSVCLSLYLCPSSSLPPPLTLSLSSPSTHPLPLFPLHSPSPSLTPPLTLSLSSPSTHPLPLFPLHSPSPSLPPPLTLSLSSPSTHPLPLFPVHSPSPSLRQRAGT